MIILYFSLAASLWLSISRYLASRDRLPPSPSRIPVIEDILKLGGEELWRRANRWGSDLGALVCLRVFNTPFIFIERGEDVIELLNKRSHIYSDRPRLIVAGDMSGMDGLVPLTRSGDRLKLDRRLMTTALSPSAVQFWRPTVVEEVAALLKGMLNAPDDFVLHFRRMAGSLIFATVYGYHTQKNHDQFVEAAEEMMDVTTYGITAGWVVDFLPFLRSIPWMSCHRFAEKCRSSMAGWIDRPYELFKSLPDTADKMKSFCGTLLLSEDGGTVTPELEERVKWIAASMYGAGLDTTVVALSQFIMAMVLHPEVLQKAQNELDDVIGLRRLPTFDDRPRLPYIDCILKETLRWGTPVPMTPPHRLTESDKYGGYTFPAGALFNANIWSMLHDERVYTDALSFRPERFNSEDEDKVKTTGLPPSDPYLYAFGFGRRRCPGIHFADQSLWLSMASILACFEIKAPADDDGTLMMPPLAFDGGAFRQPKPFKCSIRPRHQEVADLIVALSDAE